MKNKQLIQAMADLDKADTKKKEQKFTGNRLLQKPTTDPALAQKGTFEYYSTTRNPTSYKAKKKKLNPWTGITGIGLLQPSLTRSEMKRLIDEGRVPEDKEELEKIQANIDLANAVNELQATIEKDAPESNYTFPDEQYDFDLADAVRTSIASYKKAKSKFGMQQDGGDRYSSILKL